MYAGLAVVATVLRRRLSGGSAADQPGVAEGDRPDSGQTLPHAPASEFHDAHPDDLEARRSLSTLALPRAGDGGFNGPGNLGFGS